MLERILQSSIRNRVLVVVATLVLALIGAMSLSRLPIDAVPDITNKQVQINVIQPAYSVEDMERLVTFPIETALTGIPGLINTRSVSRNGFCQVTAVFEEGLDIHLARQHFRIDRKPYFVRFDRAPEHLSERTQKYLTESGGLAWTGSLKIFALGRTAAGGFNNNSVHFSEHAW